MEKSSLFKMAAVQQVADHFGCRKQLVGLLKPDRHCFTFACEGLSGDPLIEGGQGDIDIAIQIARSQLPDCLSEQGFRLHHTHHLVPLIVHFDALSYRIIVTEELTRDPGT